MDYFGTLPLDIFFELFNDFLNDDYISHVMLSCTSHRLHQIVSHYADQMKISHKLECYQIASRGYLNILKWAHQNGYTWDHRTCAQAALHGHFEILKWAREKDCDWDIDTPAAAAEGGHLEILKWSITQNCPKEDLIIRLSAIKHNHLHILKWTTQMNFQANLDEEASIAAKFGYLDIIKELYPRGTDYNWPIYASAALNDQIEVIKWMIETDENLRQDLHPTLDESSGVYICANAALNGHLETLGFLRENGFPWNSQTCMNAVGGSHLEVLLWARSNGCEWDSDIENMAKAKWPNIF
jgi:hypothetical protein